MSENKQIMIAGVGDLHVRVGDKGRYAELFAGITGKADVLVIAGDLTDTGDEDEAQVLADELRACAVPVVAVLGNHDHEKGREKMIRQVLQSDRVHILDGESVEVAGVGFAGIKGFGGGFDGHMLSMFGEAPMKAFVQEAVDETLRLDRALDRLERGHAGIKKVVVMHYSPMRATVQGEPEAIHPFLGCSRMAEPLMRRKVDAVFHGHAHSGVLEGQLPGGIRVFNVAMEVLRKRGVEPHVHIVQV